MTHSLMLHHEGDLTHSSALSFTRVTCASHVYACVGACVCVCVCVCVCHVYLHFNTTRVEIDSIQLWFGRNTGTQKVWTRNCYYTNKNSLCCSPRVGLDGPNASLSKRVAHAPRIATHCDTLQHTTTHYNILQHTETRCNILQHTATHCNTLQHTATHCNTLQHTATHCNTLQHTATHENVLLMHLIGGA